MKLSFSLGAAVLVLASSLAVAQPAPSTAPAGNPFAAGTYDMTLAGSYIMHISYSEDRLYNLNLSVGKYIIDNTSVNLELQGYYADQPGGSDNNALIAGLGLLIRTHVLRIDRFSLFFDGGVGVSFADHEIPLTGTRFNFTPNFGVGGSFQLHDHVFLMAGARYFHMSNARIQGYDRNPSYNGIQYWSGLMWTW